MCVCVATCQNHQRYFVCLIRAGVLYAFLKGSTTIGKDKIAHKETNKQKRTNKQASIDNINITGKVSEPIDFQSVTKQTPCKYCGAQEKNPTSPKPLIKKKHLKTTKNI